MLQLHSTVRSQPSVLTRDAVHAVYALCRWVDDIVDGDEEPIVELVMSCSSKQINDLILRELHPDNEPSNPKEITSKTDGSCCD